MKNGTERFLEFARKTALLCFSVFAILFFIANVFFTVRQYNTGDFYKADYQLISLRNILLTLLLLAALHLLHRKKIGNSKILLAVFLTVSLLIGIYWIRSNVTYLVTQDDAMNVMNTAQAVALGDLTPLSYQSYINTYPNNLGLMSWFLLFTRPFGEYANTYIRLVNLLFCLAGYAALYGISDLLFEDERVNYLLVCLFFLQMQFVFYCYFIYGNAVSYASGMIGIWGLLLYLRREKKAGLLINAFFLTLSIFIKNNSLILLVAELIFLFLHLLKEKKLLIGYMAALLLLTWAGTSGVVRYWEERSGNNYDNRLPKIAWIAYGLNYEMYHPGSYTPEIEDYYKQEGWSAEAAQLYAEDFIERILDDFRREPAKALTFYSRKFRVAFANPEYEAFAQYRELPVTETNQIIISGWVNDAANEIWDAASSLIALGTLIFAASYWKKKDLTVLLPAVIVLGGFLFHAFWEVKAIYLYQYHLFLLPYAAYGLSCLFRSTGKTKMVKY